MVGLVLVLLAAGGSLTGQFLFNRWDGAIGRGNLLAPGTRGGRDGGSGGSGPISGPLTYLVIGTDRRPDDPDAEARADAILIAHLSADLREAYLISVPRDLLVHIPGHGDDKINAAYHLGGGGDGGAQLLSQALSGLTGVDFDGAAVVDFNGFEAVVDALGGVEMCLDEPVRSIHTGAQFAAGCQHLNGGQALDLARQRYGLPDGDFDRGRNHQRLIQEMVEQATSSGLLTNPVRLDRVIRAAGNAVTLDTSGIPLPELALALRHLRSDGVVGVTLPSSSQQLEDESYVLPEPDADSLYQALQYSQMADWVTRHPSWRTD